MLPTEVEIASYDPAWPAMYEREAERLRRALSHLPFRVDHVGSTAVPGLAAKPIVDVLGGRPAGSDPRPYVDAIVALGWVHRGENGIPGRDYFRLGDPVRTHHLHLFVEGAPAWREHLAFRDTLRARPALAREYERLKRARSATRGRPRCVHRRQGGVHRGRAARRGHGRAGGPARAREGDL